MLSLIACTGVGCLGPMVDDTPGYSPHILPAGAEPPRATDDETLRARIDTYDGVPTDVVKRRAAWADGSEVHFWDLGTATRVANPGFLLRRCDDEGTPLPGEQGTIDHPYLIDTIPGAASYTPFWAIELVCVTEAYRGERIVSLRGIEDAIALGLVHEPLPTTTWMNAAITLPEVRAETEGALRATSVMYYRGRAVFAIAPEWERETYRFARSRVVSEGRVFVLSRDGEEKDGNAVPYEEVVFAQPRVVDGELAAMYTPLVRVIRVVMSTDFVAGSVRDADELVVVARDAVTPLHPAIVELEVTDEVRNYEILWEEAAP